MSDLKKESINDKTKNAKKKIVKKQPLTKAQNNKLKWAQEDDSKNNCDPQSDYTDMSVNEQRKYKKNQNQQRDKGRKKKGKRF